MFMLRQFLLRILVTMIIHTLIVSYIYNRNCHLVLALLHPAAGDF